MSGGTKGLYKFNDVGGTLNCVEMVETKSSAALRCIDDGLIHGQWKTRFLKKCGDRLGLDGLALFLSECCEG